MMHRFSAAVTLLLLLPTVAQADWHSRSRALREKPELQGKIVRMLRFEDKEVEAMITSTPIEFFPA